MKNNHDSGFGSISQSVNDDAVQTPALDLRKYLSGPITACGLFFSRSGRVKRSFTMDMVGCWDGNRGTLDEHFRYNNGETGNRCWHLTFTDDETFVASAHDLVGTAKGRQSGNVAVMRYRLRVMRGRSAITVGMEDWFYLINDRTLINRARMSKFGVRVGELMVTFRRCPAIEAPAPGSAAP
ncbi:MAG: DUF3833 family protein [Gammaproteobacteria bacterium]|nr:DUF3833 family protein [Gammaproteobacteria bacterium]